MVLAASHAASLLPLRISPAESFFGLKIINLYRGHHPVISKLLKMSDVQIIFQTDLKRLGWYLLLKQEHRRVDLEYRTFLQSEKVF